MKTTTVPNPSYARFVVCPNSELELKLDPELKLDLELRPKLKPVAHIRPRIASALDVDYGAWVAHPCGHRTTARELGTRAQEITRC